MMVFDVWNFDNHVCPASGGCLCVMRIYEQLDIPSGKDIITACSRCELDWAWNQAYEGLLSKKTSVVS